MKNVLRTIWKIVKIAVIHAFLVVILYAVSGVAVNFWNTGYEVFMIIVFVSAVSYAVFYRMNKAYYKDASGRTVSIAYVLEFLLSYMFNLAFCWYNTKTAPLTADLGPLFFTVSSAIPYIPAGIFVVKELFKIKDFKPAKYMAIMLLIIATIYLKPILSIFYNLIYP